MECIVISLVRCNGLADGIWILPILALGSVRASRGEPEGRDVYRVALISLAE